MSVKSLDALLDEAAVKCDALVKELDERIPNHVEKGKVVHEEHPTEAQIAVIVAQFVNAKSLEDFEPAIEAAVRSRMKSKAWEYREPVKK